MRRERIQTTMDVQVPKRIDGRYQYGLPDADSSESAGLRRTWVAQPVPIKQGITWFNTERTPFPWQWITSVARELMVTPLPPQLDPRDRRDSPRVSYFVPAPTSEVDIMQDGNADITNPTGAAGEATVSYTVPGTVVRRDRRRRG